MTTDEEYIIFGKIFYKYKFMTKHHSEIVNKLFKKYTEESKKLLLILLLPKTESKSALTMSNYIYQYNDSLKHNKIRHC